MRRWNSQLVREHQSKFVLSSVNFPSVNKKKRHYKFFSSSKSSERARLLPSSESLRKNSSSDTWDAEDEKEIKDSQSNKLSRSDKMILLSLNKANVGKTTLRSGGAEPSVPARETKEMDHKTSIPPAISTDVSVSDEIVESKKRVIKKRQPEMFTFSKEHQRLSLENKLALSVMI